MLFQSLSELCWFAVRGCGANLCEASREMMAISGHFFPAFPAASSAPCTLLAPLQQDAGTAVLPEDGVASQGGTRGPGLLVGLDLNVWNALTLAWELQRWLYMQIRLHLI